MRQTFWAASCNNNQILKRQTKELNLFRIIDNDSLNAADDFKYNS